MEAWLHKALPRHVIADDMTPVIAILQMYTNYVKVARLHFEQLENHVTSKNNAKIRHFMSQYLGKDLDGIIY
jgi:hypothetical protein